MPNPVDRVDHTRRPDQGVAPPRHRCRPGMRLLPSDGDLVPALTLSAGHDANRLVRRFEDRALLDMRLEIGGYRPAADRLGAGKADPFEFGAEGDTGQIVRPRRRSPRSNRFPRGSNELPGDQMTPEAEFAVR